MRTSSGALLRVLVALSLAFGVLPANRARAQFQPGIEQYRGFWVDTFNSSLNNQADVARVVQDAADAGANAIFAQVRRRGDSWYVDSLEPPPDGVPIEAGFDPLAELLGQAHARDIDVHAFVIVCSFWNSATPPTDPRHVFNRHGLDASGRPYSGRDNWLTRTLLPDSGAAIRVEGHRIGADFWMDPGHPDAAAYTVDVLTHLVRRYEIDGLHLDRIRYPEISIGGQTPATGANIGYNETSVRRYQRRHGFDPGSPAPAPNDPLWSQWRRDQVTQLVRRIYLTMIAIRPQLEISAALIAFGSGPATEAAWTSAEAYWRVYQDWRAWTEEGILDLAIPMNYKTEHTATGVSMYDQWVRWTRDHQYGRLGLVGQGAFLNGVEGTLRQTRRALALGPFENLGVVPSQVEGRPDSGQAESSGRRAGGVVFFSMATSSAAVAGNPFSFPPGQDTPRRSFQELASALRSGRSADGSRAYEDAAAAGSPIFAEPARIPDLPWKSSPSSGHLMGFVRDAEAEAIDGATVTAIHRRSIGRPGPAVFPRPYGATTTDGGGFYGLVDLSPGDYRIVVDTPRNGRFVSACGIAVSAGEVATLSLTVDARRPAIATCVPR